MRSLFCSLRGNSASEQQRVASRCISGAQRQGLGQALSKGAGPGFSPTAGKTSVPFVSYNGSAFCAGVETEDICRRPWRNFYGFNRPTTNAFSQQCLPATPDGTNCRRRRTLLWGGCALKEDGVKSWLLNCDRLHARATPRTLPQQPQAIIFR